MWPRPKVGLEQIAKMITHCSHTHSKWSFWIKNFRKELEERCLQEMQSTFFLLALLILTHHTFLASQFFNSIHETKRPQKVILLDKSCTREMPASAASAAGPIVPYKGYTDGCMSWCCCKIPASPAVSQGAGADGQGDLWSIYQCKCTWAFKLLWQML